jgi:hypothetical protein
MIDFLIFVGAPTAAAEKDIEDIRQEAIREADATRPSGDEALRADAGYLADAASHMADHLDKMGEYCEDSDNVRHFAATVRAALATPSSAPDVEGLRRVREYVANNRDVWSDDPSDQVSVAIADVYQKVLNVIDTGNPMDSRS